MQGAQPEPIRKPRRILVIDDDEDVRNGLARALATCGGFKVTTAADGFMAGFEFARHRPDLVILDIVMPGMGGFDICERMRRLNEGEKVKIIVLTGYPGARNSERSLLSGADLFLIKPQDMDQLLMHIHDLLGD